MRGPFFPHKYLILQFWYADYSYEIAFITAQFQYDFFFIILSFYQVHQVLKFCYISKASQNFIFCYFCNVQVSLSLIKFFVNTKRFKKLLYCNMENLNSILNRREIYCYIIEEIIGLKLPDYQFMKYINILRIPLLWLSIQQIFQLLYVPYICISIKKRKI